MAPSFTSLAFRHRGRPYSVEAVEETSADGRSSTWHWRVMANGVVEHTLRAMPHEDRTSLETRAIRTLEETAAGAVRELDFDYEGKRYHLEDRSDKLRRDSSGDTGMWCVTCDGVMEGSFQAKSGESEAILRARAIQIARRSGEYQATLRSNRPTRGKALRQHLETKPRTRPSQPAAPTPRTTPNATAEGNIPAKPGSETRAPRNDAQYHQIRPEDFQAQQPQPEPTAAPDRPRARATLPRIPEPRDAEFRRPARHGSPEFFTQPMRPVRSTGSATQRISGPISGRISGPTVAAARPNPSAFESFSAQLARFGRSTTRTGFALVKGSLALISVLALAPIYAFRSGNRPRHRSRLIRATQHWVEAVPVRMLVPYAAGAALALGIVPVNATIWAAGGMAVLLFPIRVKGHTERFQIAEHTFDRTRTVVPTVEVQKKQGLDDPRRVTRRRRGTSSHRLLRSSGR